MADPIINNAVRAQCIWQSSSGLPEDRFVTTWAFVRQQSGTIGAAEQAGEVAERLREFWVEPVVSGSAVRQFLPDSIVSQGLEIRCYDLGETPPRQPRIFSYTGLAGSTGQELPREVAVAMSFYAERNLARRRGRVYVGPLTVGAVNGATDTTVKLAFRTTLVEAATRLATGEGVGDNMDWSVLSPTDVAIRPVTAGWVDDAFDTVRKRGQEATGRTSWP